MFGSTAAGWQLERPEAYTPRPSKARPGPGPPGRCPRRHACVVSARARHPGDLRSSGSRFCAGASPEFEVATLKLSPPPAAASISINLGTFQNGRFTLGNVTLNDAVLFAFDLPSKELLVGLDWSDTVRFDVEAIAPWDTPPGQLRLMVRHLLEERLHLATRTEQRTLRHIALVVGKGGSKLKASTEPPMPTAQLRGRINHRRMPMRLLASLLSRFEQQLVVGSHRARRLLRGPARMGAGHGRPTDRRHRTAPGSSQPVRRRPGAARIEARRPARAPRRRRDPSSLAGPRTELSPPGAWGLEPAAWSLEPSLGYHFGFHQHQKERPLPNHG